MTSKRLTALCLAGLVAGLVAGAAAGPASAQAVTVKLATLAPQGSEYHLALQEMAAAWQKASNGSVVVRLYPGGVAGDDTDVVRKLRLGTINAGLLTSGGLIEASPDVLAMQLPLAFPDYATFDCTFAKAIPALDKALEAKGLVVLAWTDGGFVQFFSKNPVRTPDDLRREKMFVWAGDDLYLELWKSARFNVVPLPSTEMSTGLQTGLVTALPSTPQAAILMQWYQQAKNMTELNWSTLLGGIVVAKATWDKIPAAVRPALTEAARKAAARMRDNVRATYAKDVDAMKKRGLTVIVPDEAALKQWRQLVDDVLPKVKGKYIPAEPMEAVLKYRDECRAAGKR